jgi:hypothetical protein
VASAAKPANTYHPANGGDTHAATVPPKAHA